MTTRERVRAVAKGLSIKGLRVVDLRLLVALMLFTSIHQKRRCLAALDRLEESKRLAPWPSAAHKRRRRRSDPEPMPMPRPERSAR